MAKEHVFNLTTVWTGNNGSGTSSYEAYGRNHTVFIQNKPDMFCSADPAFRGDGTRYNPEDLLVSALSACHMLWYLHLCADAGVVVIAYSDKASGTLNMESGKFTHATLRPEVTVTDAAMVEKAMALHKQANEKCFIANSCNFPVHHFPVCKIANS